MNRIALLLIPLIALTACKSGKKEPAEDKKAVTREELIGTWQDFGVIAAELSEVYLFKPDGTFLMQSNTMDCEERLRGKSGTWELDGNKLTLNTKKKFMLEGGRRVKVLGSSCLTPFQITDGSVVKKLIEPHESKTFIITKPKLEIDKIMNPNDHVSTTIGGVRYWRHEDSPRTWVPDMYLCQRFPDAC